MQRRIVQLITTDTIMFAVDSDGRAWRALRTGGGEILEWKVLPPLPEKPASAAPKKKVTRKRA